MEDTEIITEIPAISLQPAKIYVHHYDKNTKEYLYREEAEIDKQATKRLGYNVPLLPAYSTLKLVPEYGENEIPVYSSHTEQKTITEQVPVYDEETGEILSYEEQEKSVDILVEEWTVKPDYRKNFYKVDDNLNVLPIDTIGVQEGFYVVDKSTGDLIKENPDKYKISDENVIAKTDEEYSQEQAEKERQRLNLLNLTKADVLLALYQDKGITPEDIKTMLKDNVPALIKFDYASSYYRGDEVVNALGLALGYSTEEMDYLFENKTFPPKVEEPADTDSDNDSDTDIDSDTDTDLDSDTDNEESEVVE